jgi:hypothetical protein
MPKKPIRQIRVDGQLAYVPLTQGYEAIVDCGDIHLVSSWNWSADVRPHTVYAVRSDRSSGKCVSLRMHRAIIPNVEGMEIDHINGNGLDNSRSNLRVVTKSQNQQSKGFYSNNKSGFKGVCWNKSSRKWEVQVRKGGVCVFRALFDDKNFAASVAQAKRQEIHGRFAGDIRCTI